jgi:hypothetical protein
LALGASTDAAETTSAAEIAALIIPTLLVSIASVRCSRGALHYSAAVASLVDQRRMI